MKIQVDRYTPDNVWLTLVPEGEAEEIQCSKVQDELLAHGAWIMKQNGRREMVLMLMNSQPPPTSAKPLR